MESPECKDVGINKLIKHLETVFSNTDKYEKTAISTTMALLGLKNMTQLVTLFTDESLCKCIIKMKFQSRFNILLQEYLKMISEKKDTRRKSTKKKKDNFQTDEFGPKKKDYMIIEIIIVSDKNSTCESIYVRIFIRIMCMIFGNSGWAKLVKQKQDIPYFIRCLFSRCNIKLRDVFIGLDDISLITGYEISPQQILYEEALDSIICIERLIKYNETSLERVIANDRMISNEVGDETQTNEESETSFADKVGQATLIQITNNGGPILLDEITHAIVNYSIIYGEKKCPNATITPKRVIAHPYVISMCTFALCNLARFMMRRTGIIDEWWSDNTRIYMLAYDWLNDQVIISRNSIPMEIYCMLQGCLYFMTGIQYDTNGSQDDTIRTFYMNACAYYFAIFKHTKDNIKEFHTSWLVVSNGHRNKGRFSKSKLAKYKTVNMSDFRTNFISKLHCTYNYDKERRKSLIRRSTVVAENESTKCFEFERNIVSPLDLFTSMKILEFQCDKKEGESLWDIFFTRTKTYLIVDYDWYRSSLYIVLPYILFSGRSIIRNIPYPTHHLHLINYFSGNNRGRLLAMKYILRTFFDPIGKSDHNVMPDSLDDKCIEAYGILHLIIARFGDASTIWNDLVSPFNNIENLMFHNNSPPVEKYTKWIVPESKTGILFKPRKVTDFEAIKTASENGTLNMTHHVDINYDRIHGLREQSRTIYDGIRSFIHTKTRHYIMLDAVHWLLDLFCHHNILLQIKYHMVYLLIEKLAKYAETTSNDIIPLPETFEPEIESLQYIKKWEEFPLPTQFILYFFCLSPDIKDSDSKYIFTSILSETTKLKTNRKSIPFSFTSRNEMENLKIHKRPYYSELLYGLNLPHKDGIQQKSIFPDLSKYSNCAGAFEFLMQSLEELSMYPLDFTTVEFHQSRKRQFRGSVKSPEYINPLSQKQILENPDVVFENTLLDSIKRENGTLENFRMDNSMPIYASDIVHKTLESSKYSNIKKHLDMYGDIPPFFEGKDLLECILLYTIVNIQCVSTEKCDKMVPLFLTQQDNTVMCNSCPLDLRVMDWGFFDNTDNVHGSPTFAKTSPRIQSEMKNAQLKMLYMVEDRKGWNTHACMNHILRECFKERSL